MNLFFDQHYVDAIREGRFAFAYALHPLLSVLIALLLIGLVWFLYRSNTRQLSPGWKTFFISLRASVVVLLFLILLRPVVTTYQVNPQETYLAVLIDDSESMAISDTSAGQSRQEEVTEALSGSGGVLASLAENYRLRTFRFDRAVQRITDLDGLTASGNGTSLNNALQYVNDQLGSLPLAGVVLLSDGADNTGIDPLPQAQAFGARQIPLFTVGVGQEQIPRDIGIVDVAAEKTILDGSVFNVSATLWQQGFSGRQVELRLRDGEEVVASKTVQLGSEGTSRRYELELSPERRELIVYTLEVDEQADEMILENNRYQFLVDNTERPPLNILYVDGNPRNEFKFIRRAATDDSSLRLASYLQTGPGRFYRQGIETPLELSNGFPRTREELYRYEAIIIGDMGREFFTEAQLEMIQDFVAERGGGLMVSGMLEDAFVDTVIADVLPVTLVRSTFLPSYLQGGIRRGNHATGELYTPRITSAGEVSPLLRLDSSDAVNREMWRQMPQLQGVYVTGRPKPGASVLMEQPDLQYQNQALPVIATQRYGSGRSIAIATASTWRWQMLMHSTDDSHERIWRQMLRWLAVSALERVAIEFDREYYNTGDTVHVSARVLDATYRPDSNASLWLQRTDPLGQTVDTPMEWDLDEDGVYRSSFRAEHEGVYRLLVDVASAAGSGMETEKHAAFVVTPSLREFTDVGLDTGMLRRIAEASGGSYIPLSQIGRLPDEVVHTPGAYSHEVQEDLWDTPWLLLLLISLLCIDWAARRQKGLS